MYVMFIFIYQIYFIYISNISYIYQIYHIYISNISLFYIYNIYHTYYFYSIYHVNYIYTYINLFKHIYICISDVYSISHGSYAPYLSCISLKIHFSYITYIIFLFINHLLYIYIFTFISYISHISYIHLRYIYIYQIRVYIYIWLYL